MAYSDPLVDVSDRVQKSILDSLGWAATFGNQFNENFVEQQRIAERLSSTRLNDANNRFGLQERNQNWNSDLEGSRLQSQLGVKEGRYALDNFEQSKALEREEQNLRISTLRQQQAENMARIGLAEQEAVNRRTELEIRRLEQESSLEAATFDRMYEAIEGAVPYDPTTDNYTRYEMLLNEAKRRKSPPQVIARITKAFIEDNADIMEYFGYWNNARAIVAEMDARGGPSTPEEQTRYNAMKSLMEVTRIQIPQGFIEAGMKNKTISGIDGAKFINGDEGSGVAQAAASGVAAEVVTPNMTEADFMAIPLNPETAATQPAQQAVQGEAQGEATVQEPAPVTQPAAEPAPAPVPQVTQAFKQPEVVNDPANYVYVESIEQRPDFPAELAGLMKTPVNTLDDFISIAEKLNQLKEYYITINADPIAKSVLADYMKSLLEFANNNGI